MRARSTSATFEGQAIANYVNGNSMQRLHGGTRITRTMRTTTMEDDDQE
jgi:hypothetical protein